MLGTLHEGRTASIIKWPHQQYEQTSVSGCLRRSQKVCKFHQQLRASLWIQHSSSQPGALTETKTMTRQCYRFPQLCSTGTEAAGMEIKRWKLNHTPNNWSILPSYPELWRCSPRSQPNTLSLRIPRWRNFCGGGLDFIKDLRKVTSFPCFLHTVCHMHSIHV